LRAVSQKYNLKANHNNVCNLLYLDLPDWYKQSWDANLVQDKDIRDSKVAAEDFFYNPMILSFLCKYSNQQP